MRFPAWISGKTLSESNVSEPDMRNFWEVVTSHVQPRLSGGHVDFFIPLTETGTVFSNNHVTGVCLPSQSASKKHNQEKKPTNLCAPRAFLKRMCLPCLIIIHSCYFDYRISKPFACSRMFRSLLTWSRRTTRPKDHRLFLNLNYPQINEVEKADHTEGNTWTLLGEFIIKSSMTLVSSVMFSYH